MPYKSDKQNRAYHATDGWKKPVKKAAASRRTGGKKKAKKK